MSRQMLPTDSVLPLQQQPQPRGSISTIQSIIDPQDGLQEANSESPADDDESDTGKPTKRQKRSRACIACRGMKIRCLPVEGQDACLGCSKVNRECIMPGPARKRQKTVHKVAELEKKINALTEALVAKNQGQPTPPSTESPATDRIIETQSEAIRSDPPTCEYSLSQATRIEKPFFDKRMEKDMEMSCFRFKKDDSKEERYVDVIDRGILDMEAATLMFDHWKYRFAPLFPVVSLPDHVQAHHVRAAKPMLFLSAIAVTSSAFRPSVQPDLVVELNRQVADRVLFLGEKSIDLVQAILVYTSYFMRSKYAKDLAFNQYIHAATIMCLDLGMGKKYRQGSLQEPFEEAEVRRTWLGCFHTASNVAALLRHPTLVRWSPYIDECIHFLETSPAALPTDKWLCSLLSLQRITEEVSIVFSMDDPSANISFTETKTQYHLKAFERQLSTWKQNVPREVDKRMVEHLANSINLYIHEIAIHNDHNVDEFRAGPQAINSSVPSGSFVTTAHIDALTTCVDSSHKVLGAYLAMDLDLARSLNNLYLVWNTYAIVTLIKLHGVLHATDSKFGSIFTPDLKVDYYIDAITTKLAQAMKDNKWPPAEAFGFVTKKLKSWHTHKKAPNFDELNQSQMQPQAIQETQGGISQLNVGEQYGASAMRGIAQLGLPENYAAAFAANGAGSQSQSDLNVAFDAANYNINWDDLNFSATELNTFDTYMNDAQWMSYII